MARFNVSLLETMKGELVLEPGNGFVVQNFAPGFPEVRDNVDKRPQTHGTNDLTRYFGAKPVVALIGLAPELIAHDSDRYGMTDHDLEMELRGWMLPELRPYVRWQRNGGILLRTKVRAANVGSVLDLTKNRFHMLNMSWRAPEGINEVDALEQVTVNPGGTGSESGRTYNLTFDRTYPASTPVGLKEVINSGNVPVCPVITFFGPMTQIRIENTTTGKKLEFLASYTLNSGEYLVVDCREGTVYLNGLSSNSRYDKVDFSVSEWFDLMPGSNFLRLYPGSFSSPASALVEYRSAFI